MKRTAFCFVFSCAMTLCISVFAQDGSITGTLSFDNETPVAFASLSLKEVRKQTVATDGGYFEFTNVPFGHYTLEISSIEAEEKKVAVTVNKTGLSLAITLERKVEQLREVEINGKSIATEIKEAGFAVSLIETQQAALINVQTNDLLDRTAGVRVRRNGGMGSSVDYNLNGMSGNSVRIFIDGIPISTYGSSFSLNSIPPALIDRIEIYKGVIPAHLADDALGGAINVVLKNAMRNNLSASVSYGSFNTVQANLSSVYRHEKSGLTVRASGFHNYSDNDYEVWGKFVRNILPNGRYDYVRAKRFNNTYRSTAGQLALGFTNVKWADQFFIGYNASDDYNEIQHGTYMTIPYKGRFVTSRANIASLNYRKANLFVPGLEFTVNAMRSDRSEVLTDTVKWNYNWYGEKSLDLNGGHIRTPQGAQQGAPTVNHIDRGIATFRAGLNYEVTRNHRIVFNHSLYTIDRTEQDEMKSAVEREFIDTRSLQKNISSVAYELKAFDNRLSSNIFAKYYNQQIKKVDPRLVRVNDAYVRRDIHTGSTKETLGYGLAFSYEVLRHWMILASAEKAVRMPAENEIFGSPGDNIIENFGINAETSYNLNVGIRAGTFTMGNHSLMVSGTGFVRDTRDKITQRINPRLNDAVQTNPYENQGKVKAIGFEAEANYTFKRNLNVVLNASRFNSAFNVQHDAHGRQYEYYNQQLPNEPFFTINSMVQYTFHDVIGKSSLANVYSNFGFVDSFYTTWLMTDDSRTPRQYVLDLGISYRFANKKFVISADARNVLNQQVYDNFAVQRPGRAFYLKLNYTINNF